jgi:hypothetical protein
MWLIVTLYNFCTALASLPRAQTPAMATAAEVGKTDKSGRSAHCAPAA